MSGSAQSDPLPASAGPADRLTIGQVAEITGVPITTLRFYEKRGLIDPPARENGQRRYDRSVLMRLMVIQFCQVAGLKLEEIVAVLDDETPGRRATKSIAADRISAIDDQMTQLALARHMMRSAIRCCCESVEDCGCGAMDESVDRLGRYLAGR